MGFYLNKNRIIFYIRSVKNIVNNEPVTIVATFSSSSGADPDQKDEYNSWSRSIRCRETERGCSMRWDLCICSLRHLHGPKRASRGVLGCSGRAHQGIQSATSHQALMAPTGGRELKTEIEGIMRDLDSLGLLFFLDNSVSPTLSLS